MCDCFEYDDLDEHRNGVRRTRGCAAVLLTAGVSVLTLGIILTVEFAPNYQTSNEWTLMIGIALLVGGLATIVFGICTCGFVEKYLNADWGQLRVKMIPKNKPAKETRKYDESTP